MIRIITRIFKHHKVVKNDSRVILSMKINLCLARFFVDDDNNVKCKIFNACAFYSAQFSVPSASPSEIIQV